MELPPPARYTPWTNGVFTVAPGLRPLGTDFGNGEADAHLVQFDRDFDRYRGTKRASIAERRAKYVRVGSVSSAVIERWVQCLLHDHPHLFLREDNLLHCALTGDTVNLSVPEEAFEALALQIQPDVALVEVDGDGADRVQAIHVCAPSRWHPAEKFGRSFVEVHVPVPGFAPINRAAPKLVEAMVERGPFIRFVWTVETDDRLNHHPEPPNGLDAVLWNDRPFERGRFWMRVERQTLLGIPEARSALFFIHVKFVSDHEVMANPAWLEPLKRALLGMDAEVKAYKGISNGFEALLTRLSAA